MLRFDLQEHYWFFNGLKIESLPQLQRRERLY
jgi:hypothetical protein